MAQPLLLIDGNNHARVTFETDTAGLAIRRLFTDVFYNGRPTIVIFDGKNAKQKRREIFEGYKVKRKPATDGFYRVLDFWKEMLMHTHAVQMEVPGFEADDIIGQIARTAPPELHIEIKSTDRDYCVLENERVKIPGVKLEGVSPKDVRLYKTLVGDSSDSVPGLHLFGQKSWELLTELDKTAITSFLNGECEWTDCLKKESHNLWVRENSPLLRSFWQVVDFLPVPHDLLGQGTKVGRPDLTLAESKLADIFQGPASVGKSWEEIKKACGMS